ncbi:MAG: threonine/serine dehydratase [Candidatus Geothermarchaeales archaeon]
MYQRPTFQDILRARHVISKFLPRTPLYHYPSLSRMLGFEAYVKHENHLPVGAFKVRGGINLVSNLSEEERRRGVIAASTGNHGQSVAYASKIFGVKAIVVVPRDANPGKVEAMRNLGAEVIFHGRDYEEAKLHAEELAEGEGYRYIHSGNEPLLIAGVGTIGLEIMEDLPDVEVIIVPVGGGSGASGVSIAAKAVNSHVKVIAVQAERAPSVYLSWREGRIVETESADTFAEGLATRRAFELPLEIIRDLLDDFVLVSEQELREAILILLEKTHNLAEGAGAASLAAAVKLRESLGGRKVVLILSGGNLSKEKLNRALNDEHSW